jgi:hypothetical protein
MLLIGGVGGAEGEYRTLLDEAGFELTKVTPLERIAIACKGKWRDFRYGRESVSDLSLDQQAF